MIEVSVIIPFRGDADTLRWTLDGFAHQHLADDVSLDVRVGGDGCEPPRYSPPLVTPAIKFSPLSLPRSGVGGTKNLLLSGVHADVVIFANADTRPVPDCVSVHVSRLLSLPEGCMVLGGAPYDTDHASVFDCFKDETPAIFFYHQMRPHQFYDYRHAWNLNISVRHADLQKAGGFSADLRPYGYEDLDFAFKLMGEKPSVFYDPAAKVLHRHPMTLEGYLDREEALGCVAPNLCRVNAPVFQSLFGMTDLRSLESDYRTWTSMDRASHRWTYQRLCEWVNEPRIVLGPSDSPERKRMLMTLYQMHIPLKRLAFRLGFLRGLELMDDSRWLERGNAGLWREAVR